MTTDLESVLEWYKIMLETQDLTNRALKSNMKVNENSNFYTLTPQEAKQKLKSMKEELDDLAILKMVSIFESIILDYLAQKISQNIDKNHSPFFENLHDYAVNEAERWRFVEVLDMFKGSIDSQVIGQTKQVYKYRNWVAHGKKTLKPYNLDPINAYETLTKFLKFVPDLNVV